MKMKSDHELRQAVFLVLEKLREGQNDRNSILLVDSLTDKNIKNKIDDVVSYPLFLYPKSNEFNGYEEAAIKWLCKHNVIKEVGERDEVLIEDGLNSSNPKCAYSVIYFEILQSLNEFMATLIKEDSSGLQSQFTFWVKSGRFVAYNERGQFVSHTFPPQNNAYKLLVRVLLKMGEVFTYDDWENATIEEDKKIKIAMTNEVGSNNLQGGTISAAKSNETDFQEQFESITKEIRKKLKGAGLSASAVKSYFKTDRGLRVAVPFTLIPK